LRDVGIDFNIRIFIEVDADIDVGYGDDTGALLV
jgi:hypothetical protein